MRYRFVTCDVFAARRFSGNQLAVLPEAEGLSAAQMQAIAAEFGHSETTFVLPPDDPAHLARVRIFTPMSELPFAGHPTVGTALVLAWLGRVPAEGAFVLEEAAGPVPVEVRENTAEFTAPAVASSGPALDPAPIAAALGLNVEALRVDGGLPRVASHGVPFLLVELGSCQELASARLARGVEPAEAEGHGVFLFTRDTDDPKTELRARMFAPSHKIPEDPATGSAAAALAGFLGSGPGLEHGWHRWRIRQGMEMGRPSLIEARARHEGGRVVEVRIAGRAVPVTEGTIEADP